MRVINLERRFENIKDQIGHYKTLVNDCSVTYTDSPKSTTSNYKHEDCPLKIMDLQVELCSATVDHIDVTCEIAKAIQKLDNYDYQDLLINRYVLSKTWKKIAKKMSYSEQHIHRLHGEALKKFSEVRVNVTE